MSRTGPPPRPYRNAGLGWCHSWPGLTKNALAPTMSPSRPSSMSAAARLQPAAHERVGRAADPQARGRGELEELAALGERRGERLLRVDVLARAERGQVERRVGIGRREVEHDVDLGDPRTPRRASPTPSAGRAAPALRRALSRSRPAQPTTRDDVAVPREVDEVDVADVADADDPDPERRHAYATSSRRTGPVLEPRDRGGDADPHRLERVARRARARDLAAARRAGTRGAPPR